MYFFSSNSEGEQDNTHLDKLELVLFLCFGRLDLWILGCCSPLTVGLCFLAQALLFYLLCSDSSFIFFFWDQLKTIVMPKLGPFCFG